ncbi:hypothetical protein I0Q91_00360 [Halanaerobiaceae bacterium Z-7014]|uniref:Polymer-forming cytoskeletal protein n=1 Tax=Halonatronomonas betaini TaxID=2778430 RepID=A0A931APM5_9FIRM|nr:hypothetical protein [Halonatronomonas betaini]MBF8435516.1 hypothetical protein [Halonatronomonas betaini]
MNINDYDIDVIQSGENYIMSESVNCKKNIIVENSIIFLKDLITSENVSARYDMVILGDCYAKEVQVNGNMICLGDLKVDRYIDVGGKLSVFGKSDIKKGIIEADIVFVGSCFLENTNINSNYIVKGDDNGECKNFKLDFGYEDIQKFLKGQGSLNYSLDNSLLLQNKIKKYIKRSEGDLEFDGINILLKKLSKFNHEFKEAYKFYSKVSELSFLNKITEVNDLFDLLIIQEEIPEFISNIGLVNDVLNHFIKNKNNVQIKKINLDNIDIKKLSKMIYLLKKNKKNLDNELYENLSDKLLNEAINYLN